jgi:uncharacterized protein (TIGR02453 family)
MTVPSANLFPGFPPAAVRFLKELREHNSKTWFDANRAVYANYLLAPFQQLVAALSSTMLTIDPRFEVRPAVNKTISRVHRDVRFSRDKSLYRDTMWLVFKRPVKEWTDDPGFFFELSPSGCRYGMGFYSARRATMDAFRREIDDDPKAFLRATKMLPEGGRFGLFGDKFRRPLPCSHGLLIQDWYQRRSWYLACHRKIDRVVKSPALADVLRSDFSELAPLYRFVRRALNR